MKFLKNKIILNNLLDTIGGPALYKSPFAPSEVRKTEEDHSMTSWNNIEHTTKRQLKPTYLVVCVGSRRIRY